MPAVARVLIVDDSEPWRRLVRSLIEHARDCEIVAEATDGADAIVKARELRPDLILLDIGLPTINGIEAARRILQENPDARILFVSEQRLWDVAESALATGARGYMFKLDAGRELIRAIQAVLSCTRFVSSGLAGRFHADGSDARAQLEQRRHTVGFYSDETSRLIAYVDFVEAALDAGRSVIVVELDSRLARMRERHRERGTDIERASREGRYVTVSVPGGFADVLAGGRFDEQRFWQTVSMLVLGAAKASRARHPRVAACGAFAPWLAAQGDVEMAIRAEQTCDELTRVYDVDLFCTYPEEMRAHEIFHHVCSTHSAVLPR